MDNTDKVQYNDYPVFYCKHCLSLKIKSVSDSPDLDYCDNCGSTDIENTHISRWSELYRERYGLEYLNKH